MANFAGARAKLATATQDLFRLSGSHSIPVEASTSEPPAPSVPDSPLSSARKPEASIMFSLEALMKANQTPPPGPAETVGEASSQLWNMQSAEPLFGTAHDQALLTTPLKMEPAQSMDSMTLPSEAPNGRRLWPILLAAGAGLALAGGGIWMFGPSRATTAANAATPSSEHAALAAQLPAPADVPPLPAEAVVPALAATPPAADEPAPAPTPDVAADGEKPPVAAAAVEPTTASSAAASTKETVKEKEKDKPSARKPPPRAVPTSTKAAFDKGAAKTALASAASAAAACGAGGAPAKGKIQVTFAPTGKVSDAQLVEGPFAGTTAGKCAMRHFRAVKVPAFSGAAVTVAKSFKVD
jgi:hypothetical protein